MKLIRLRLENFQGVRLADFTFDGQSASIYGDNATGKTTVFNAFTWLLFDKASTGAKNFTPKTEGSHGLDHSSEAVIETEDGARVTLKKVFHEVYKKKRGSAEKEFSGHTTDSYIDGVPVSATEFSNKVSSLVGTEEQMKMLTMPDYFPSTLSWQKRREILLQICGDISDEDVIAGTPELTAARFGDLLTIPGAAEKKYTVEEFRKILTENRKKLNAELTAIPERIDEAEKAIPDTGTDTADSLENARREAQRGLDEAEALAASDSSDAASEISVSISNARLELSEARRKYSEATAAQNEDTTRKIAEIHSEITGLQKKGFSLRSELSRKKIEIEDAEKKRSALIDEFNLISSQKWDDSKAVCPTCHRPYDPDKTEELKAEFNRNRSEKLADISERGKKVDRRIIAAMKEDLQKSQNELDGITQKYAVLTEQAEALKEKMIVPEPFENTMQGKALAQKIADLQAKVSDADAVRKEAESVRQQAVQEKREALQKIMDRIADLRTAERQRDRIEVLRGTQKDLAKTFEQTERLLHLCDVFTRAKVDMLDARINSRFSSLRFRLFEEQINGGLKDCCEVLIPTPAGTLVPYASANNAAKICAGLEIIHTLAEAWNMQIPVFVDNAEAVTHLTEYPDMQIIRLVVSESDKTLRMESDSTAEKAA